MGSSQSTPSTFTHETLFQFTKEPRLLMNHLLDYMLKEVTVKDFMLLSNPEQCKKYIMFMTNSLHQFFYELKIEPIQDKRGVIAFREIKDVTTPPTEKEKREKESLCLILSYFYTRIFQIYGALALTLMDDVNVMASSGLLSQLGKDGSPFDGRLAAPGYRSYTTYGGQKGGQLPDSIDMGQFAFLRSFLIPTTDPRTGGYLAAYPHTAAYQGSVSFKVDSINNTVGTFYIGFTDSDKYAYLELRATTPVGRADTDIVVGSIRYYKRGSSTLTSEEVPATILAKKQYTVTPNYTVVPVLYLVKNSTVTTINSVITDILNKVIPYIKTRIADTSVASQNAKTVTAEAGTESQLRLSRIMTALTRDKPMGHCIGRALQLLKTLPFKDEKDKKAVSFICKARFLEVAGADGTRLGRSGIPLPNDTLDKSPGLSALSQLFYDTITVGTPRLKIGEHRGPTGQSSLQQYVRFMKYMATLFGDGAKEGSGEAYTDHEYVTRGLTGIKNRRDKKWCDENQIPEEVEVSADVRDKLSTIVATMFRTQYNHANACGKIFKMLFQIDRDPSTGRMHITLSANIIKNGLPEIDRINHLARDLLIEYYSKCETEYIKGMKEVGDHHDKKVANKAKAQQDAARKAQEDAARKAQPVAAKAQPVAAKAQPVAAKAPQNAPRRVLVAPGIKPTVAPAAIKSVVAPAVPVVPAPKVQFRP